VILVSMREIKIFKVISCEIGNVFKYSYPISLGPLTPPRFH